MNKPYTLDKSYELLNQSSKKFIKFADNLMNLTKVNEINLIGIGNSISSGWTAIDNNVNPFIKKLEPFINDANISKLNINFANFAKPNNNANNTLYELYSSNPSLSEIRNLFSDGFDLWKNKWNGTMFENYVDKDIAMSFYPEGEKRLFDYYNNESFTITSFFGSTGEILQHFKEIIFKTKRNNIQQKDIIYLDKIIDLITSLSNYSCMVVGNFPYLTKDYLFVLNHWIKIINKEIEDCSNNYDKTLYFDGANLELVNKYNGKLKIDNHPSLEWQYTCLYNFLNYIMQYIPIYLMKNDEINNKDDLYNKYKCLDYDNKLQERMLKKSIR